MLRINLLWVKIGLTSSLTLHLFPILTVILHCINNWSVWIYLLFIDNIRKGLLIYHYHHKYVQFPPLSFKKPKISITLFYFRKWKLKSVRHDQIFEGNVNVTDSMTLYSNRRVSLEGSNLYFCFTIHCTSTIAKTTEFKNKKIMIEIRVGHGCCQFHLYVLA